MPNPRTKEFPLRHSFGVHFQLLEEDTGGVDFATYVPLFFADQAKAEADAQVIQVNPQNDTFEGVTGSPACFMNSRVNKIKITEYCMIPAAYDVPDMMYYKAIVSWGLGDYQIKDPQGVTLLTDLGFVQAADTIHPNWTGTDLDIGTILHADVDGLT